MGRNPAQDGEFAAPDRGKRMTAGDGELGFRWAGRAARRSGAIRRATNRRLARLPLHAPDPGRPAASRSPDPYRDRRALGRFFRPWSRQGGTAARRADRDLRLGDRQLVARRGRGGYGQDSAASCCPRTGRRNCRIAAPTRPWTRSACSAAMSAPFTPCRRRRATPAGSRISPPASPTKASFPSRGRSMSTRRCGSR